MKSKIKYYLIKYKGVEPTEDDHRCGYIWLARVRNNKLLMEYNLHLKEDVTHLCTSKYRNEFVSILNTSSSYDYKEITKEEAFLVML